MLMKAKSSLLRYKFILIFLFTNLIIVVKIHTSSFIINGAPASRTQFPLINAFALTVHKVQGITLPCISLNLDSQMFEKGQAYTAISRCNNWNDVKIKSLSREAFKVDKSMIQEYERLKRKASEPLPLSRPFQTYYFI